MADMDKPVAVTPRLLQSAKNDFRVARLDGVAALDLNDRSARDDHYEGSQNARPIRHHGSMSIATAFYN